jgi:nitrilase
VQIKPARDTQDAIATIERIAKDASLKEARLVLFPEAYVGGYPRGASFGTVVGNRSDEGREAFRKYWENAIDVPGTYCEQIANIAQRYAI